jgi:hypothetical protein
MDIGARCAERGHQPYTAHDFFLKYSDRILLGTELIRNLLHFHFLETDDQFFQYSSHSSRQGKVEYLWGVSSR